jgi:hypothetical protein
MPEWRKPHPGTTLGAVKRLVIVGVIALVVLFIAWAFMHSGG